MAARMNLDRRRSHTGLPARRPSVQQPQPLQQQHQSHKRSPSPRGSMVGQSSMLLVPNSRPRGSSLPGNIEVVNQDDIYRLRNFSTAGKKLVNRGDSLKARSHTSIASTNSRYVLEGSTSLMMPPELNGRARMMVFFREAPYLSAYSSRFLLVPFPPNNSSFKVSTKPQAKCHAYVFYSATATVFEKVRI